MGIAAADISSLLALGCDSIAVLKVLQDEDWDRAGLPLGKKRLVQHALRGHSEGHTMAARQLVDLQCPTGSPCEPIREPAEGQLKSNIFLGMGVQGDQRAYFDICDFVSLRSPFEVGSGAETTISHKADGSFEVKPSVKKRVSLDKISMAQWMEGNTQIMARLLQKGVDSRDYMSYTVLIAQLAQKYEWLSVVMFDLGDRR